MLTNNIKFIDKGTHVLSRLLLTCLQKRNLKCEFPERHQHDNLAENCYKIEVEVTPKSKLATVRTGETIAMVLSALINSSGGVLIIHLVTKTGATHDISLSNCQKNIVDLITQQEKWIPDDVFIDSINCIENNDDKELYFFVSKTAHLVTPYSNASYLKQSTPESIVNHNALMGILKACTCESDTCCEKHKELATQSQVLSMIPNREVLNADEMFPVPESDSETHLYRNYQINDRSLPDVLKTQSVQCEILDLVSALANTKGGSIFLGVTNTATPTVEGYRLTEKDEKCTEQCISEMLTGRDPGAVTFWGYPQVQSTHYWKTFLYNVVGDDNVRKVIEIRVNKCPGGMFCALPVCLDIGDTGEIYQLYSFAEWKKRFIHNATDSVGDEEADDYHKHFVSSEMMDQEMTSELVVPPTGTSIVPKIATESGGFPFCWWVSDYRLVTESLQFDQCCSKELAESEMDISTKFTRYSIANIHSFEGCHLHVPCF